MSLPNPDGLPVLRETSGQTCCSPMRAERAKPKSCKDDEIIAQGKRSAALGYGGNMVISFFPSGLAPLGRAKPEGKKETGRGGVIPRAAASAALPWAIILLPLRGVGKANQRAGGEGGMIALFRAARLGPAAPHHGRWPCEPSIAFHAHHSL